MELKNVEKLEKSITALTIEISAAELDVKDQPVKKNGKNNYGFRKGKAPRKVIEGLLPAIVFEDALDLCYPKAYDEALEKSGMSAPADVELSR